MITNFDIVDRVLEELGNTTDMAVLHREADVASRSLTSDVDVCVRGDAAKLMGGVARAVRREGFFLVMIFPYDRGSNAFFFSDHKGTSGAQIDLLSDPAGASKYGVRSGALLDRRVAGVRWPRIEPLDEALYTLRKRQVKRDQRRFDEARERIEVLGAGRARARAEEVFSPPACAAVTNALRELALPLPRTSGVWKSRVLRPHRLRHRCGYWAYVPGASEQELTNVAERFGRLLISAKVMTEPSRLAVLSSAWRPHLLLSAGRVGGWPIPDIRLDVDEERSEDSVALRLVRLMHEHVIARLPRVAEDSMAA